MDNYEKYYRIAFGYVSNESDALDVVQESAYKAIFYAEKLCKVQYTDTWICRIVINEAKKCLLRNQHMDRNMETWELEKAESTLPDAESGYQKILLEQAMSVLSPKERSIVVLRYFEGMSLEEVAEIVGEKLSTVKSRLYRALEKMRVNLS